MPRLKELRQTSQSFFESESDSDNAWDVCLNCFESGSSFFGFLQESTRRSCYVNFLRAYRAVSGNIPFMNLFYIKTVYDYLIGFNMMETMSPGALKRVEKRMKKDYNQEYLLTKPSSMFKGF